MRNIFGRLCWRGEHGQTQSAFPIPAAQTLIDRLDLDGKRVDLDALHPQDLTAQKLFFERGADCVMTVKANQKSLYQTLETKLQGNCSGRFPAITSTDHLWLGDPKWSDKVVRTVPCAALSQETPFRTRLECWHPHGAVVRVRVRRRPFRTGDCADHFRRHPRRSCAR